MVDLVIPLMNTAKIVWGTLKDFFLEFWTERRFSSRSKQHFDETGALWQEAIK